MSARRALTLLVALALAGLGGVAAAHPFGEQFYSHQITASLTPDRVVITLVTEKPTAEVMKDFFAELGGAEPDADADSKFTAKSLASLKAGIEVRIDGAVLPGEDVTDTKEKNGVGNASFFAYRVSLAYPWKVEPGQRHTVDVFNRNPSGGAAYYRNEVMVSDTMEVLESTHFAALADPAVQATQGWTRDQSQRDLHVVATAQTARVLAPEGRSVAAGGDTPAESPARRVAPFAGLGVAAIIVVATLLRRRRSEDARPEN